MQKMLMFMLFLSLFALLMGCNNNYKIEIYPPTPTPSILDKTIEDYADCVNSRFPLSNTYGSPYVDIRKIHTEINEGNLTVDAMVTTYKNLGCGDLKVPHLNK